jgi:hypothetical protein
VLTVEAVAAPKTAVPLTVKLLSITVLLLVILTTPVPAASNSKSLSLSVVLSTLPAT